MNTKLLMTASAIILGVLGLLFSFAPQEVLLLLNTQSSPIVALLIQLIGAGYFGFAMLNWMAKANAIGGIYSRPISVANFGHFFIAGAALFKFAWASQQIFIGILAFVFILLAIAFGLVMQGVVKSN